MVEAFADRFVGRSAELEQIERCFKAGHRIVTVAGAPGMGKTRLAVHYLGWSTSQRTGGAWTARCAGLMAAEALWQRVGQTLGVGDLSASSPEDVLSRIGDWLAARGPTILLLDNFEQLVAEANPGVARLVARAPTLRILVTSRQRLGLRGEAVIALGPLSLAPDPRGESHAEAVELFVARAEAASGLLLDAMELAAARGIVETLEAVPLAIELAAARAARLGVIELRARLEQGLAAIERAPIGTDDGSTLTAAIEWSWTLLSEPERAALSDCAVFRGGFSLAAAEAVVAPGSDGSSPVALIERLLDRSLLRSTQASDGSGRRRLSLYESIREFAARRRRDDGAETRHARYFAEAGRAWADRLARSGDREARALLTIDQDNLAFVARQRGERATPLALDAILALDPLWRSQGPHSMHLAMLDEGLALAAAQVVPAAERAALLVARGEAQRRRGRVDAALGDLRAGLEAARIDAQPLIEGRALAALAIIEHQAGRLDTALVLAGDAIALHRATSDGRHERISRITLGLTLVDQERLEEAQAHFEETLALAREAGDRWAEGLVDMELGRIAGERGRVDEARARIARAELAAIEVADLRNQALALGFLAGIEHEAGGLDAALHHYRAALALLASVPGYRFEGLFHGRLCALFADLDRLDEAVAAMDVAAGIARRVGDPALDRTLRLHAGHLEVRRARAGRPLPEGTIGDPSCPDPWAEIDALLERVSPAGSEEIRYAHRLLRGRLRLARAGMNTSASTLTIATGALRFRIDGAAWISLLRRRSLSRVLSTLADARRMSPGEPVAIDALLAAGWPGERFNGGSGVSRLRMAIATLRKLGLRDVLVTSGAGYQLDPSFGIHVEPATD